MAKVRLNSHLEDAEVGDELYFKHTILGGDSSRNCKVARITKTLIVDDKGGRWRIRDGKRAGHVRSRGTLTCWQAHILVERIP